MAAKSNIEELRAFYEAGKNPMAYIPYAEALRRAGVLNPALEVCNVGLVADVFSIKGRTLLAKILYDMGRYDNALEELGSVLQQAPDAFGTNLLMAKILAKKREFHDALDIVQSIKKMNASDPELLKLENFLHSQIYGMETKGGLSGKKKRKRGKPLTLEERIDELIDQLKDFPGVKEFNFSRLPDDFEQEKGGAQDVKALMNQGLDPMRSLFLIVSRVGNNKGAGPLNHLMIEMEHGSVLMFSLKKSLLKITTNPKVNLGKLRLQVESLMGAES